MNPLGLGSRALARDPGTEDRGPSLGPRVSVLGPNGPAKTSVPVSDKEYIEELSLAQ